jgi:hypothetical protein
VIDSVLEWRDNFLPDWVVLGERIDGKDLSELNDVSDLELLKLKIGIKDSVVELSEETKRISSRQILLLAVIDGHSLHDLWSVVTELWLGNSLEVVKVLSSGESILELFEVLALLELLGSAWVEVTKVVEELLSHALTLGVAHLSS